MNPEESRRVGETVRRLRDHDGIAVLLIEHDMRVVMTACDRVVFSITERRSARARRPKVRRATRCDQGLSRRRGSHA